MKTITVKLPDSLFAEIADTAKVRKVSKSEIVRERLAAATSENLAHSSSLWSRMEDLVVKDDALPADLSSNKKHLANYGKKRPR